MSQRNYDANSLQKNAKLAGWVYFLIIFTNIINMIFGPMKLIIRGDNAQTLINIIDNMLLFRVDLVYELIMYASVVVLAVALYNILKVVNKGVALLAMMWRIIEALLGCIIVLGHMTIVSLAANSGSLDGGGIEKLQSTIGFIYDINAIMITIVFTFLSAGSILFCYLFLKSKFIPKWLSIFGIVAYGVTVIAVLIGVIVPIENVMMFGALAILFELIIGLWLMIKGVDTSTLEGVK